MVANSDLPVDRRLRSFSAFNLNFVMDRNRHLPETKTPAHTDVPASIHLRRKVLEQGPRDGVVERSGLPSTVIGILRA